MNLKSIALLTGIVLATFAAGFGATVWILNNCVIHVQVDSINFRGTGR